MKADIVRRGLFICAIMLVLATAFCEAPLAQDAASFYKGKALKFVVGYTPGGGYDVMSRVLGRTIEKYAHCTVVVLNKPGAGGLVGLNYMYNSADKEGLSIMIAPLARTQLSQLLKLPGVQYDCQKFNWFMRLSNDPQTIAVSRNSNYKTLSDLKKPKKIVGPCTSPGGSSSLSIAIAAEALGLDNFKMVCGYPGSSEEIVALMSGQADMYCPTVSTYLRHSKELRALAAIDRQRDPLLPDVPAIYEAGIADENKKILEIYLNIWEIGRALITSPGVPPERVKFLNELFVKCVQDEEFIKTCKKMDISIAPLNSEKVNSLLKSIMSLSQESIDKLKNVAYDKYM